MTQRHRKGVHRRLGRTVDRHAWQAMHSRLKTPIARRSAPGSTIAPRIRINRFDDFAARIGRFGFALRSARHGGAPLCVVRQQLIRSRSPRQGSVCPSAFQQPEPGQALGGRCLGRFQPLPPPQPRSPRELGGASQGLAGADVAGALLGVVDDDDGDAVAANSRVS